MPDPLTIVATVFGVVGTAVAVASRLWPAAERATVLPTAPSSDVSEVRRVAEASAAQAVAAAQAAQTAKQAADLLLSRVDRLERDAKETEELLREVDGNVIRIGERLRAKIGERDGRKRDSE
jgi:hypothetical protein